MNDESMIKVSIIIPVYDTEKFVLECISSVMNQSYREFEALVIDDCGTDQSIEFITNYLNEHDSEGKFHIIKHSFNRGLSAARNTGINHAKGDYIYFLDSDDYLPHDALENLILSLQKYPKSDIVYGNFNQIPYRWMDCFPNLNSLLEHYDERNRVKRLILNRDLLPELSQNKLLSLDFIFKYKLFFKEGIIHEDTHYTYYLAKYAREIVICKKYTYHYRKNQKGIMLSIDKEKHALHDELIALDCFRHMDSRCLFSQIEFVLHLLHTSLILKNEITPNSPKLVKLIRILVRLVTLQFRYH